MRGTRSRRKEEGKERRGRKERKNGRKEARKRRKEMVISKVHKLSIQASGLVNVLLVWRWVQIILGSLSVLF